MSLADDLLAALEKGMDVPLEALKDAFEEEKLPLPWRWEVDDTGDWCLYVRNFVGRADWHGTIIRRNRDGGGWHNLDWLLYVDDKDGKPYGGPCVDGPPLTDPPTPVAVAKEQVERALLEQVRLGKIRL